MEQLLRVGVITSPHGLKGEVKVYPTTDDKERFLDLETVILDLGRETKELDIEHITFFKNLVLLKFRGIDNINLVEPWRNKDLLITREQAVTLEDDENFIVDLIGLSVVTDTGEHLGSMADVLRTGANDVYCVRTDEGKEILLPATKECILDVNLETQTMKVHVLDGLLDL